MATTYIEPLRSVRQRTDYTEGENATRPLASFCDLGSTPLFVAYCERQRELRGRMVEGYGVRVSWDDDELSAQNPDDVALAVEFGRRLCDGIANGYPCHIVAHGDGAGGKLHVHCEIANSHALTGAALRTNRSARHVRALADGLSREYGLSVIGETPAKRTAWESSRGIEREITANGEWEAKRVLPDISGFERELGDAVAEALAGASGVEDFKRRLREHGVSVFEVPKREKGPDGKRHDVVDPATGEPEIACWRYVAKDAGGRTRRRKDSNLCPDFRMNRVLPLLKARESAIEGERADYERIGQIARTGVVDMESRRLVVDAAEVSEDIAALFRTRFEEVRSKNQDWQEPLLRDIDAARVDGGASDEAIRDLRREVGRAHKGYDARKAADETPDQTRQAILAEVERTARRIVTRMLAALWRLRIALERRMNRAATRAERDELALLVIRDIDQQYGTAVPEPITPTDERQVELEYTHSKRNRQQLL